jgi:alpha-tubulin suppressor-like RCC1 family protein
VVTGWRIRRQLALLTVVLAVATSLGISAAAGAPLTRIGAISAGEAHACAQLDDGRVRCWGRGIRGQLGNGGTADAESPVPVMNAAGTRALRGVKSVVGGSSHTCAVLRSGQARCWGNNSSGQLGDGSKEDSPRPVTVKNASGTGPLQDVVAMAAGDGHSCAVLRSGKVRCWGANQEGQLGDGTTSGRLLPVLVKGTSGSGALTRVVQLDAGLSHTCARVSSGQLRCWGDNVQGQLGDGTKKDRPLPVTVRKVAGPGPLTGVARVDAGDYHTCAVLTSERMRCWGYGEDGQLGDGSTESRSRPVAVRPPSGSGQLTGVADIGVGAYHSCARLATRRALCWGENDDGQLGNGTTADEVALPVAVRRMGGGRLSRIAQVAAGYSFTCARLTTGVARCWGANDNGQLGDGTFTESHVPVPVGSP